MADNLDRAVQEPQSTASQAATQPSDFDASAASSEPTMQGLYNLLDQYDAHSGDEAKAVEEKIWSTYGVNRATLCLDMSGFSRMTRRFGIVHYLALVRRMQLTTRPLVAKCNGEVVKFEADNLFATFQLPQEAVRCALDIQAALQESNALTDDDRDIRVSIGIAWGRILVVPGKDLFGDAVNVACKLGEDLAQGGETLIDDQAKARLPDDMQGAQFAAVEFSISGMTLSAWQVTPS